MRGRPERRSLDTPEMEERIEPERIEVLDWEEARLEERFRKVVVLGDPGFGKSWLDK
jgi:hypothetical protein